MKRQVKYLMILVCMVGCLANAMAQTYEITVYAGDYQRKDTPVSASVDLNAQDTSWVLYEKVKGKLHEVPFQLENASQVKLHWVLDGEMPAKSRRKYVLSVGQSGAQAGAVMDLVRNDTSTIIYRSAIPLLQYNHALVKPPPDASVLYTRSGFIHPLRSPSGFRLTNIFPADHYHHLGLWNPWTSTTFEGREVDFWNLGKGQGTIRFQDYLSLSAGAIWSGFTAFKKHIDLTAPTNKGSKTALHEQLQVQVYSVGDSYAIMDYVNTYFPPSDSGIVLNQYRYGGLGFRGNEYWSPENSYFLTSSGKTRELADASNEKWVMIGGETDMGEKAGLLIMSHVLNRAHPEPIRVWENEAVEGKANVFFVYTPIRQKPWKMEYLKKYVQQYRIILYDGILTAGQAESFWTDFCYPPDITISKLER